MADAVDDDYAAAVVDFDGVGHVGAVGRRRYIDPRRLGSLRVGDVPRAYTGVEVRGERQPAVVRIAEVLLGRMRAEALATQAVVATQVFLTRLRIDPQRREHHRSLPRVLPHADRVFRRHVDDEAPMLRITVACFGGQHHDIPHVYRGGESYSGGFRACCRWYTTRSRTGAL